MTREEKLLKIETLKKEAFALKKEADYYNALQLALKLVLNGSYGAFASNYFVIFNNYVASTITAEGRALTQTMDRVNDFYWYDLWHLDTKLHKNLCVKNVKPISKSQEKNEVSIYADTDSVFSGTIISSSNGSKTIENWYNENIINGTGGETINGHESVLTNVKIVGI